MFEDLITPPFALLKQVYGSIELFLNHLTEVMFSVYILL